MRKRATRPEGDSPLSGQSDIELLAGVWRGDVGALSCLYDRYGCLVFTLTSTIDPACAELITEEVFLGLWRLDRADVFREPVLATLLRLTAEVAEHHRRGGVGTASAGRRSEAALPALAPFAQLSAGVFDVLVLACLGGLHVGEIAVALGRDRDTILKDLAAGLALVRGNMVSGPAERATTVVEGSLTQVRST